ncbi:MAG: hypothetical protein JWP18_1442 [Solirubrobacterales bacterium]|nr:hypothetical protein [Solirubrobacterales bacterium]
MRDDRPRVAVHPQHCLTRNSRLLQALEAAFDVQFVPWHETGPRVDALILAGDDGVPTPDVAAFYGVPALAIQDAAGPTPGTAEIRIGEHAAIDRRLRGVVLVDQAPGRPLVPAAAEAVLAWGPDGPAWTTSTGACRVDRVGGGLPVLADGDVLRDGLRTDGALALLALVQLLRAITPGGWSSPGLRATFVFDDPNLRHRTYGHLDYRKLLAHADAHGYHAAMAMVPLDARRPSEKAVRTFRDRPDRLSLVMHGNDHLRDELMRPLERTAALALGAQALRRIARFERATGVGVDRVMMPPHGCCSAHVLRALGELGYEAVCAIHPAPWTEVTPPDRLLAGWSPAEFIDGCAILPRFPLTVWATEIALRAFLDQPLVLYGHHDDAAGGLESLAEAAARVNGLGDVRWCSVRELARASHASTVRDGVLRVRPWARVLQVGVPDGVHAVLVEAPPGGATTGFCGWETDAGPREAPWAFGAAMPIDTVGGHELTVRLVPFQGTDPGTVASPPRRAWPVVRRRATEARDRLAPLWAPR